MNRSWIPISCSLCLAASLSYGQGTVQCVTGAAAVGKALPGAELLVVRPVAASASEQRGMKRAAGGNPNITPAVLTSTGLTGGRGMPAGPGEARGNEARSADGRDADNAPKKTAPAMLWAALALMAGIALRRFGAGKQ